MRVVLPTSFAGQ